MNLKFNCKDCGGDCSAYSLDDYMVFHEVWCEAHGIKYHEGIEWKIEGRLCLSCLKKRLGRGFKGTDFQRDLPINHENAFVRVLWERDGILPDTPWYEKMYGRKADVFVYHNDRAARDAETIKKFFKM